METKTKILVSIGTILFTFAAGRYSVQNPTVKIEQTKQTQAQTDSSKDEHKKTVETETRKPDGTVVKTTTSTDDIVTVKTKDVDTITSTKETITPPKTGTLNVSALVGMDMIALKPVYGASVSKEILGPITIGLFGITNGTLGASIGINF